MQILLIRIENITSIPVFSDTHAHALSISLSLSLSARQYREAAKLSSEEKELTAEIEKGKEEVTQMEKDLSFKNDGLGTLNQELEQLKEERREAERESGKWIIGRSCV